MTKNVWSIGDVALWLDAAPVEPVGRASGRMSGELVTIELLDDGRPCLVRNGAGVGYDPRPQPCRLLAIPALRSLKMVEHNGEIFARTPGGHDVQLTQASNPRVAELNRAAAVAGHVEKNARPIPYASHVFHGVAIKILERVNGAVKEDNVNLARHWLEAYRMLVTAEVK